MAIEAPTDRELLQFQSLSTLSELAAFLGTTPKRLNYHLYSPKRPQARRFSLRKKSGGIRPIIVPPSTIVIFQRRLLRCFSHLYEAKPGVYGFAPNRGTVLNAKRHLASRYILNFDLLDFFPSIHFGRVRGVFEKKPFYFTRPVATVLAQICCVDSRLPQGACTSPVISNLVCRGLDDDMYRLSKRYDCAYSRYADDMTISTNSLAVPQEIAREIDKRSGSCLLGHAVECIVDDHDFKINPTKTRLRGVRSRQEVTGLVVNKKLNVPREYVEILRAKLHSWEKSTYAAADIRFRKADKKNRLGAPPKYHNHIHGLLDYLRMVRGNNDPLFLRYWCQYFRLCRRDTVGPAFGPIVVQGAAIKHPRLIAETIWIVVGEDASGDIATQGTAFLCDGLGVVTAKHVISNPATEVYKWKLVRAVAPWDQIYFPASAVRKHLIADLAIIHIAVSCPICLVSASGIPQYGDAVYVCGFPNWSTIADKVFRSSAFVTQSKNITTIDYFTVNIPLLSGNSGGPVLDSQGRVIGVVVNAPDHKILPNAVIAIHHASAVV